MRWLKRMFRKIWDKHQDRKVKKLNKIKKLKKVLVWGFMQPHNSYAQGASNNEKTVSEYNYFTLMYRCFKKAYPWANRRNEKNEMFNAYERLKVQGVTASIESHKNAFNRKAAGYLVIILENDMLSRKFAECYIDLMNEFFPMRQNRKIKEVASGENGFWNLYNAKKNGIQVALLTEDFFIDNDKDWIEPELMARVYEELLIRFRRIELDLMTSN